MEKTSPWAALYFVALMTFGNYVLFNLLVAILVEGFSSERQEREQRALREKEIEDRKKLEGGTHKMSLVENELPDKFNSNGDGDIGDTGAIISTTAAVTTTIDSPPLPLAILPALSPVPLKNNHNNHHHNSHNHSHSKYQPSPGCSAALVPAPVIITHTAATPEVSVVLRDCETPFSSTIFSFLYRCYLFYSIVYAAVLLLLPCITY